MIAEGTFPFASVGVGRRGSPRVGDGLVRLDDAGTVTYASPNAVSAYRRLGLTGDLVGEAFGPLTADLAPAEGPVDEATEVALSGRAHRRTEVEARGTVVALRAIPLCSGSSRTGAIVLVRDVTELRRRERELVTKDATIREIHHRVKNNLQTVASLLRLQARRIEEPRGRAALAEAVRRVGSIAVVHETLSKTLDETVEFDDIADRVIAMAGEISSARSGVRTVRTGTFARLPAEVATPLALVLNELVQNAVEHGFAGGSDRRGTVEVRAERDGDRLHVEVIDDGRGLPDGFDLDTAPTLGLQIVRTLVLGELGGRLEARPAPSGGACVVIDVLVPPPTPPG
jgi:two-component sensor histidine kinase